MNERWADPGRATRLAALTGLAAALLLAVPGAARAQWDPGNGLWRKSDPRDVRIMTWNVRDHLCSTAVKQEGMNSWTALAVIVAALRPDVLLLQEAGDNSGNGTGSGVDSAAELDKVLDLFLHGGADPFRGGAVTAYVQRYAPGYDLPYGFASGETDQYNRNAILSRAPFRDLNGDGRDRQSDIPFVLPDAWAPGGDGGIRGFQFVEIDLKDTIFAGDLVVGNAHLKSGGDASSQQERLTAAQNVSYYVEYLLNGAGSEVPDPNGRILDSPPATMVLDPFTPVVLGGDWNEDETTNGRDGPALWLVRAASTGGGDGTDRDGTDAVHDAALHPISGSRATFGSSSKLDYQAWQDSIAAPRRQFVFSTTGLALAQLPPEVLSFPVFPLQASTFASDHRPVLVDLRLPLRSVPFFPSSLVPWR